MVGPSKRRTSDAPLFAAPTDAVFEATLQAVRSLPGWEILAAEPGGHALRARARGRIFSPSMDHEFSFERDGDGTRVRMTSKHARTNTEEPDERGAQMFYAMLNDHLAGRALPTRAQTRGTR